MAVATMVTENKGGVLAMDRTCWFLPVPELTFPWNSHAYGKSLEFPRRAMFASVGLSVSCGAPPTVRDSREQSTKARPADTCDIARQLAAAGEVGQQAKGAKEKMKKNARMQQGVLGLRKVRVKIANPHLRRLVYGAITGAVSRTFVAPLATIRMHLMVGSCSANSMVGVFRWIMRTEGWTGLLRDNSVNILRVASSKAIEASYTRYVLASC